MNYIDETTETVKKLNDKNTVSRKQTLTVVDERLEGYITGTGKLVFLSVINKVQNQTITKKYIHFDNEQIKSVIKVSINE